MDEVKLFCVVVGEAESAFAVQVGQHETVYDLKKTIIRENANDPTLNKVAAKNLQLFLAKKDKGEGAWLTENDVQGGVYDMSDLKLLGAARAKLRSVKLSAKDVGEVDEEQEAEEGGLVNVLVTVPEFTTRLKVKESQDDDLTDELAYYQRLGREIQNKCQKHCRPILDKIDTIYEKGTDSKPFICVEGSSGMGKSQLAFSLGGEGRTHPRPWFYWPLGSYDVHKQFVYENFKSIASAFKTVVDMDKWGVRDSLTPHLSMSTTVSNRDEDNAVVGCDLPVYTREKLWTYGFIIELLKYCSRTNVGAQMVRVEDHTFNVTKSTQEDVINVRNRMKKNGEVLPFFVLDEMTPSRKILGMQKLAAFQRNVFQTCGLVVIIMGTDSKIMDLVDQASDSRSSLHWWMTVVSSFPTYQSIPSGDPTKDAAWEKVIRLHPVVKRIAENSRGLFSRCFVKAVVHFVVKAQKECSDLEAFALADLLDAAFKAVYVNVQNTKSFMSSDDGRRAQLMALSYTNADSEPANIELPAEGGDAISELRRDTCIPVPVAGGDSSVGHSSRKRRAASGDSAGGPARKRLNVGVDVGVKSMHAHFANLVDESITDVDVSRKGFVYTESQEAWSPICRFPVIKEDVLLYLAVLGGKKYSAYYDWNGKIEYSIARIFEDCRKSSGNDIHGNSNAPRNDFSEFENMVAHALFCVSRINGVRGIGFDEFFFALVDKFKNESKQTKGSDQTQEPDQTQASDQSQESDQSEESKESEESDQSEEFTQTEEFKPRVLWAASALFEGYDGLKEKFAEKKIPFLAPPNAIWPEYILDACGNGDDDCNFGHLVRAKDRDRLDCYVTIPGNDNPLFVCECKYWGKKVNSGAMKKIIEGLNAGYKGRAGQDGQRKRKWNNWDLAFVFCQELTFFQKNKVGAWRFPATGIVTVDCKTSVVNWIIKRKAGKKLVIVVQTGHLLSKEKR